MGDLLLKIIFIWVLIAVVLAGNTGHYGNTHYPPMPYKFGYQFNDKVSGNQYRQETGTGSGAVTGSYGYTDPFGIYRHVEYIADHNGFRAHIKTNEPGTASKNPADVTINANPVAAGYGYSGGHMGYSGGHGGYSGGHGGYSGGHGGYSGGYSAGHGGGYAGGTKGSGWRR